MNNTFKALPKLRGLHNVYKEIRHLTGGEVPSKLTWYAKVKLHGTNAAIRFSNDGKITGQKRTSDVSIGNDNAGFAVFVEARRELLAEWYADYVSQNGRPDGDIILNGEWAGPGVQKNVALTDIPSKQFFVFAITETHPGARRSEMTHCAATIRHMLHGHGVAQTRWQEAGIRVIPNFRSFTADLRFRDGAEAFAAELNSIVDEIEKCDPYIKEVFGVEGTGEGLVFYPHGTGGNVWCTYSEFESMAFKVKGEKHAVSKAGKPARIKSAVSENAYHFADMHVTEARLNQGLEHFPAEKRNTGAFIGWVCRDVVTECAQEIIDDGHDWKKDLSGVVATRARDFFIKKCEEM